MNISELSAFLIHELKRAGIEDARLEARYLSAHVLGIPAAELSPVSVQPISSETEERAYALLKRRLLGEPLQYLLGEWEFMGLAFSVASGVLIPRPDTEVLCEHALRLIAERGYQKVLDLCCGSGCIGISISKLAGVSVALADISSTCLTLAKDNALKNGVDVSICQSDLFSALQDDRFDLICCNPPYLSDEDMSKLQREVCFEPALALHGGADGLDFYRRIAADYRAHLHRGGALLLEIGSTQAEAVCELFDTDYVLKDYAGNPRVVIVEVPRVL